MNYQSISALTLLMAMTIGCGTEEKSTSPMAAELDGEAAVAVDHAPVPPKEYFDALMRDSLLQLNEATPITQAKLYLDFDGGSLAKGYEVGESFILCSKRATIPSAAIGMSDQERIIAIVQEFYRKAGSNLLVTNKQPQSRPYTTMFVGGSMRDLGCLESRGTLGVAPLDAGNVNKNDIGFVFTRFTSDIETIAETIAHEAGHSYGLNHINESRGLMYFANNANVEGFMIGTLRGGRKQDEPKILQRDVGKLGSIVAPESEEDAADAQPEDGIDVEPPTVAPNKGALDGLADILKGLPNNPNLGSNPLSGSILDLFAGLLGNLPSTPGNLGGIGGLPGLDQIISIFGGISSNNNIPGGKGGFADILDMIKQKPSGGNQTIDLDTITNSLGIQNITQIQDLFKSLDLSKNYVLGQNSGSNKDSMMTYLKLAYTKAYQNLP